MCVVSMVGDHYQDRFRQNHQWLPNALGQLGAQMVTHPTKQEFEALKKEVEDMKALLKRAKIYDEQNNEPDCEMDGKVDLLRRIAALVGVSLDDVLKPKQA